MKSEYRIKITLWIITIVVLIIGCVGNNFKNITVIMGKRNYYENNTGEIIEAVFCELSDKSLHFVKLEMPDGKEYTLPQLLSGSGARYSDEREIEFWIKGNNATIKKRNIDGEFEIVSEVHIKNE